MKTTHVTAIAIALQLTVAHILVADEKDKKPEPTGQTQSQSTSPQNPTDKDAKSKAYGCICEINKEKNTIKIVPWITEKKMWDHAHPETFHFDDKTKIDGENTITIADVKAGKEIEAAHFLGIQNGKLAVEPFKIKELSGLKGRRTTLSWVEKDGVKQASVIQLTYLFSGESIAAMVGGSGGSVFGGDNCPCAAKK